MKTEDFTNDPSSLYASRCIPGLVEKGNAGMGFDNTPGLTARERVICCRAVRGQHQYCLTIDTTHCGFYYAGTGRESGNASIAKRACNRPDPCQPEGAQPLNRCIDDRHASSQVRRIERYARFLPATLILKHTRYVAVLARLSNSLYSKYAWHEFGALIDPERAASAREKSINPRVGGGAWWQRDVSSL
jgi:hypothetical protein